MGKKGTRELLKLVDGKRRIRAYYFNKSIGVTIGSVQ